jgi:chemotaxis family two-component system response regulator Rcp1
MTPHTPGSLVEILLIEDNPGDIRLMSETLKDGKVHNRVSVVQDGNEAMAYLRREDHYADAVRPDLILLDLNLPGKDGRQVLQELKASDQLRSIPVVILTSSQAEQDILRSYDQSASCYILKPVDLVQFMQVVKSIKDFWLTIVRLPESDS